MAHCTFVGRTIEAKIPKKVRFELIKNGDILKEYKGKISKKNSNRI